MRVRRVLHSANSRVFQHPGKKLSVLVGRLGAKGEHGAIGGAWDPADGAHPAAHPDVLIATAVRTFRAATARRPVALPGLVSPIMTQRCSMTTRFGLLMCCLQQQHMEGMQLSMTVQQLGSFADTRTQGFMLMITSPAC